MVTDPNTGLLLKYHRELMGMPGFYSMEKPYLLNEREVFGITGHQDPPSQLRALKQMGIEAWLNDCGRVEVVRQVAERALMAVNQKDDQYVLPCLDWHEGEAE